MKGKISVSELLVRNSPEAANRILNKFGVHQAVSNVDGVRKLDYIIAKYKEVALEEIAKEHPHRDLVLKFEGSNDSSADGGCGCGGMSSAEGGDSKPVETPVETPIEIIKEDKGNDHHLKSSQQNMFLGLIGLVTMALVINLMMKKN